MDVADRRKTRSVRVRAVVSRGAVLVIGVVLGAGARILVSVLAVPRLLMDSGRG